MKLIAIVVLALVAVSYAAEPPKILRSEYEQQPEGSFSFAYETEDGVSRKEFGSLKETVDQDQKPVTILTKSGSWSYTNPEGQIVTINFTADESGYHPEGPSIPVAPVARR